MRQGESTLVTVFAGDRETADVSQSILQDAGIPGFVRNALLQDYFGNGRLGVGYNIAIGPVEIQVRPEDAEVARELLQHVKQSQNKLSLPVRLLILALALGPGIVYLILNLLSR